MDSERLDATRCRQAARSSCVLRLVRDGALWKPQPLVLAASLLISLLLYGLEVLVTAYGMTETGTDVYGYELPALNALSRTVSASTIMLVAAPASYALRVYRTLHPSMARLLHCHGVSRESIAGAYVAGAVFNASLFYVAHVLVCGVVALLVCTGNCGSAYITWLAAARERRMRHTRLLQWRWGASAL